jgi:hypothetical protein
MWVAQVGDVKLCVVADAGDTEHRALLVRFVERLEKTHRDVADVLRGVEFARSIPWRLSMKFDAVPASMDGLWEQQIGGVKVLILENRDRQNDNDPSHTLYFIEGAGRRQGAQERDDGQQALLTSPRPSQPQRSGSQTHAIAEDDDVPPWER